MSNQNPIASIPPAAPVTTGADAASSVQRAIADAARRTSIDFDYLLAQAEVESSLDPRAKARTSSATGLYQFIENTWLDTLKRHGPRFGLGKVAAQIGTTQGGSSYVGDPAQRQAILDLRKNPQVASWMAAGLAEDNRAHLVPILGRQPDHGELYLAHFLGAGGAGRFLSELARDPGQSAADLFRRPASANRAIFYERDGSPRSLAQVMTVIDGKMSHALARAGGPERGVGPHPVADRAAFMPRNRSTVAPIPTLASVAAGRGGGSSAMSGLLRAASGGERLQPLSAEGSAQVRRAYDRLKALGL
ncbi:transglycosylase SLT domain-containing protein [Erythrobacter sp. JK5]|uniref:transglycosylase SLT domain-containing protein n=1 Tax=Erythrobacter sp. JK5 TaxID=2829500 RepID=UPI001BAC0C3D|nr:transglycosylase SLT domain-containing protein [Erythrobacter sp. JK5]QUL36934.1 transglycosylase SLT domain-containing protein [Erythrobacter sp. JK5]